MKRVFEFHDLSRKLAVLISQENTKLLGLEC